MFRDHKPRSMHLTRKINNAPSFQIGSGWNLARFSPSTNAHRVTESDFSIWSHNFKTMGMTSFHAKKCCRLVSAHAASARRLCSSVRQFLIYSVCMTCFGSVWGKSGGPKLVLLKSGGMAPWPLSSAATGIDNALDNETNHCLSQLLSTDHVTGCIMPKIHYARFPVTEKLPNCCGLFNHTANKSVTSPQQVGNKSL